MSVRAALFETHIVNWLNSCSAMRSTLQLVVFFTRLWMSYLIRLPFDFHQKVPEVWICDFGSPCFRWNLHLPCCRSHLRAPTLIALVTHHIFSFSSIVHVFV